MRRTFLVFLALGFVGSPPHGEDAIADKDWWSLKELARPSVPELTDLASETKETLEMYGPNVEKKGTYASSAILARRLIERGVRSNGQR